MGRYRNGNEGAGGKLGNYEVRNLWHWQRRSGMPTSNKIKENRSIGAYVVAYRNVIYRFWLDVGYMEKHTWAMEMNQWRVCTPSP
jgi:hypothetical protein